MRDANGRPTQIIGFWSNITERKQAAARAVQASRLDNSVKTILGYEVEAALAPGWWSDCLHPDVKEAAVKKTSILMNQGYLVQEYRFRANDGRYLWIRDEATLLRDADGRPKEIIGFWSNITERKHAEERAVQASKQEFERGELIGSSDRNIAVGTVIAILIIGPFLWGTTNIGLTTFVVSCSLGLILICSWSNPANTTRVQMHHPRSTQE